MAEALRIGIAGLGTVGASVARVLREKADELTRQCGRPIAVTAVSARDRNKDRGIDLDGVTWIDNPVDLARSNAIDVFVELIGGDEGAAREAVKAALESGRHVVTANKALLAKHGVALAEIAEKKGVLLNYEAAVAGGIPVIKTMREAMAGNSVSRVFGILNGTCNYILTRMEAEGLTFEACLKDAQRLGYAEADPTFDIEGVDAAHKATLIASIAYGIPVQFDKAHVEGITKLEASDIKYAEQLGYRIKLLGIAKRREQGIELRVHPTLIPAKRLIANVEGAMNAVVVKGDAVGTTLYYGKGAGAEPTASAVIADLVDVTRLATADPEHRVPHLAFQPNAMSKLPILPMSEIETGNYLRLRVEDKAGVLADVTRILADHGISIDAMLQREPEEGEGETDIIILTHVCSESAALAAIAKVEALAAVKGQVKRIRLEELQ